MHSKSSLLSLSSQSSFSLLSLSLSLHSPISLLCPFSHFSVTHPHLSLLSLLCRLFHICLCLLRHAPSPLSFLFPLSLFLSLLSFLTPISYLFLSSLSSLSPFFLLSLLCPLSYFFLFSVPSLTSFSLFSLSHLFFLSSSILSTSSNIFDIFQSIFFLFINISVLMFTIRCHRHPRKEEKVPIKILKITNINIIKQVINRLFVQLWEEYFVIIRNFCKTQGHENKSPISLWRIRRVTQM